MMPSSMAPSERRWASSRKSSMTVLGKVPKPINLPSQKLENHGVDLNVEIVPKGTLTWGSRPSLAVSNAWGSSALPFPQGDVSVISPVCTDGRPSSGGSGTRPSSSSSEISNEPTAMVWGSNSRPSSASGVFPASHISTAANRPRSAETRSGNFHLSRFAESSADSISWGAAAATEKLAAEASKRSDFTLSSGDFPTLGSEKSSVQKLQQGQCSGVSLSACALSSTQRGNLEPALTSVHGNFDSWRADADPHVRECAATSMENWHGDHHNAQPYLIENMPLQQFSPRHGHPVHAPNGVWYRGHESNGPYRPPGSPGSYLVDPYYPYVPVRGITNAQTFPRGPRPEASHSQSVIPVRPGAYPGPVLYEGCYGPNHASFTSSTQQDVPPVGMLENMGVHSQHPSENQRSEKWGSYVHPDGNTSLMTEEQMIPSQGKEIQGPYKVLLKQHECRENKSMHNEGHTVTACLTTQIVKQPGSSRQNGDKQEQTTTSTLCGDFVISEPGNHEDLTFKNSSERCIGADQSRVRKSDTKAIPLNDLQQDQIVKKNASLMQKVEGLNSKTRITNTHFKCENVPSMEKVKSYHVSSNDDHFKKVGPINASSASNTNVSPISNVVAGLLNSSHVMTQDSANDLKPASSQSGEQANSLETSGHTHFHNQKTAQNMKDAFHHAKLKFGSYGDDERNNARESDSLGNIGITADGIRCMSSVVDCHSSHETVVNQVSHLTFKHADLKELARQRAMKEEERTREQMAKAQAKLEELNQRTSENSKQNLTHREALCYSGLNKLDAIDCTDAKANATTTEAQSVYLHDSKVQNHSGDGSKNRVSTTLNEQSSSLCQETTAEGCKGRTISGVQKNIFSRRKQTGYRRKAIRDESSQSEKLASSENTVSTMCVSVIPETTASVVAIINSEVPSVPPKKRNTHGPKPNNKPGASRPSSLQSSTDLEVNSRKFEVEGRETKAPTTMVHNVPVSENSSSVIVGASDQGVSDPTKEASVKMVNTWKPQPHRKPARNQKFDRVNSNYQGSDNVVWAPVKGSNKNSPSVEVGKNNATETIEQFNGSKAKRAEMERYVPKSVAKKLSAQGGSKPYSPALELLSSADMTEKFDLADLDTKHTVAKAILTSDGRNSDNNEQNRHGKMNFSWRQRNSSKPPSNEQIALDSNLSSLSPISHDETFDLHSSKPNDDLHESTNVLDDGKDHGLDRWAFRQSKAHRFSVSSQAPTDNKMLQGEVSEKRGMQSSGLIEIDERNSLRPLNQSDHMRTYWLPKSQITSHQSQQVSKDSGGQKVADQNNGLAVQIKIPIVENDTKHQEDLRDRKFMKQPSMDQTQSLDKDLAASTESAPANAGNQHFEYKNWSSHNEPIDAIQQNSSEAAAPHWVSSRARYGDRGRTHPRHGIHFYGPRRAAAVHASTAQNNRE